ncbi:hypothetical protein BJS_01871 [Bradyrhizobium japonicum SEMIA 5079]|nr:hypothetical protein BJS_01871 [Bradyrhizobium japonicum SEMIA 5079]
MLRSNFLKVRRDATEDIGMRTAIDADRKAQSGYIAEDEQTKPEMLTQPITPAHFFRFEIKDEEHSARCGCVL